MIFSPIAIVGQSCVLPGALTPDQLWQAVREGRDLLGRAPAGYWRVSPEHILTTPEAWVPDKAWSDRGGYVRGFESVFDPTGFAVPADEILSLDTQFHWVLHAGREALRQVRPMGPKTGLVLGNLAYPTFALGQFAEAIWRQQARRPHPRNRFHAGSVAHLTAEALGLQGGAFCLDAACASSLYAIKLACDRLHDGTADLMLAGAVNRADDLLIHVGFSALQALSRSGRSRPFHRDADGLVPAEGAVLIALKRLDDAVVAGDAVLGVIRGVHLSNDGRRGGFLAPSVEGEVRALRRTYEQAGLDPRCISLVECHATGTPVGDAAEIQTLSEVFAKAEDVPLGSLKSNLGHLITVAGAAGLLKVLAAIREGVRPPTLHAQPVRDELQNGPLRVLHSAESWECEGPRRAAINAFGFGGSNAHLLVEEYTDSGERGRVSAPSGAISRVADSTPLAIVGLAVQAGGCNDTDAFADLLFGAKPTDSVSPRIEEVILDGRTIGFPPRDLESALPQQLLVLKAALAATSGLRLPGHDTGVFIGMQCDAEVARRTARLRVPSWLENEGSTDLAAIPTDWLLQAADAFATPTDASAVIGAMPNIPANRINVQLDLGGPGFTVSAEELSGVRALEIAIRGLRSGELDAALVGAVDLCCEPVHAEAAAAVLSEGRRTPGDAVVMLVLKRLDDAHRDGDPVYAVLESPQAAEETPLVLRLDETEPGLTPLLGHAHAASGLLLVAAAALSLHRRLRPVLSGQGVWPWLAGLRRAEVRIEALGGQTASVHLREATRTPLRLSGCPFRTVPQIHVFAGADRAAVLRALERNEECKEGNARLVLVDSDTDMLAALAAKARVALQSGGVVRDAQAGIFYRDRPLKGELAFVGSSAVATYPRMGGELLWAFHDLIDEMTGACPVFPEVGRWYEPDASREATVFEKLAGGAMLTAFHGAFCRKILGLRPNAILGLSSGEKDVLFAAGACGFECIVPHMDVVRRTCLLSRELGGTFEAIRRAWGTDDKHSLDWSMWRVAAPVGKVREALTGETRVHLAIIHAPNDIVLAGTPADCVRVLERLGRPSAHEAADYKLAFHVPEVHQAEAAFRSCFTLPLTDVPGLRFYSSASGRVLPLTTTAFTDAYLAQATGTVDFPRLIDKVWNDGVRVFVQVGPHSRCSDWITEILGDRTHLAVALDSRSTPDLRQTALAAAELLAAGVEVDYRAFNARMARCHQRNVSAQAPAPAAFPLHYPAHYPPVVIPPLPAEIVDAPVDETTELTPTLPMVNLSMESEESRADEMEAPGVIRAAFRRQRQVFGQHLRQQQSVQGQFLDFRTGALGLLIPSGDPAAPRRSPRREQRSRTHPSPPSPPVSRPQPLSPPLAPSDAQSPRGPAFDRENLLDLARGNISDVFGPLFAQQDGFRRQVRLPTPPLLLVDRITGIDAEQGVVGKGTIWTETDVAATSWYLHHGVMPAGLMIEAGQADLTLISWMGADFENRGERIYRLLGCDLTYNGGLARPGDTLRYDIHIDGHARQGDIRLFFFHYDCRIDGGLRMTVRNGQAGFFTDRELAESGGVLWQPETGEHAAEARVDPPSVACNRRAFNAEQVSAYYQGHVADSFGPGFERLHTHTRTPLAGKPSLQLIDEVTHCDAGGGAWGRGYLRARKAIAPSDWFFNGHFKDDPCMPGTLMFEGGLQAMSFYLTALGYTLDKDGWRFEPVPDETYRLRCRGQVTPASRELVYELFVEEVHGGAEPVLYADILCTVDGLKAFHCRRMALRLVPDWPLNSCPQPCAASEEERPFAVAGDVRGDYPALLACAWGRPSDAFGSMYRPFDTARRAPRLPSPPYHFMSRITRIDAEQQVPRAGAAIEAEYDVPASVWYFEGQDSMPYCVLLEANLQPCGWLASFLGFTLRSEEDLFFRNLDGTGSVMRAVPPGAGTLRTRVRLTNFSIFGGLVIVHFETACTLNDELVCQFETSFGFFTRDSLASQVGLPPAPGEREALEAPCNFHIEMTDRPARYFGGALRLPDGPARMIDRVTGYWPEGGRAGLGRLRSEQTVEAKAWYFKAHFYQDPVQAGSLGVEAMLQLLQFYLIERNLNEGIARPSFEAMTTEQPTMWKYRGQVVPSNARVEVELEVVEVGRDERGPYARADAWLWVDGLRIYHARNLGMRIVSAPASVGSEEVSEFTLDPEIDHWLRDHQPTFALPVAPLTWTADTMAQAAQRHRGGVVLRVEELQVQRWLICDQPRRLQVRSYSLPAAEGEQAEEVVLSVWREAPNRALSRFEPVASARVVLGERYPATTPMTAPSGEMREVELPYETRAMFHGPSFRLMRQLWEGEGCATALLDAGGGSLAVGALHPALLDGLWHPLTRCTLRRWVPELPTGEVLFPACIKSLSFYGPTPTDGTVRCTIRFERYDAAHRLVWFTVEMSRDSHVWMRARVAERLFPLGPFARSSEADTAAFISGKRVEGLSLSRYERGATWLARSLVKGMDWLPGTLARAYRTGGDLMELTRQIAIKEHVARQLGVHPSEVVVNNGASVSCASRPGEEWPVEVSLEGDEYVVRGRIVTAC